MYLGVSPVTPVPARRTNLPWIIVILWLFLYANRANREIAFQEL